MIDALLKSLIGLDVEAIGASAIDRAVKERQAACGVRDAAAYWDRLQTSDAEREALVEAVIVPETWFFRDREAFGALARFAHEPRTSSRAIRILSVPCSSGEEPYSIAMALDEEGVDFSVDAVDVSARVLAKAQTAIYGANSFRGSDFAFRARHFRSVANAHRLNDDIRARVRFQQGNLIAPAFFADAEPYEVVFCRNLFIYFDRATQERVIAALTRLIARDGLLFVGPSETALFLDHRAFQPAGVPMAFAFRRRDAERPASRARGSIAAVRGRRPLRPPVAPAPRVVQTTGSSRGTGEPAEAVRVAATPPPSSAIEEVYALADQGHFAEAARRCEEAVRRDGPSARAFYLLGLVRDASGNEADAEALYRKALYLDPGHGEALAHLALLMDRQGKAADAQLVRNRLQRLERRAGVSR